MKLRTSTSVAALVAITCLFGSVAIPAEKPQDNDAKQIIALVNSAAALIESKGNEAFPEFKKKNSKWYTDKTYVFVDDIKGTVLVNPPSPQIEGKNLLDFKDAKGKLLIREFIKVAESKGSGWVDYWWPKPGEDRPAKKRSYIKRAKLPNGTAVIVGAGIYTD